MILCIVFSLKNEGVGVLNLQKQGGILFTSAALAEAYRITGEMMVPIRYLLAQNRNATSRTQQGNFLIP
jgi:hypothetical protein